MSDQAEVCPLSRGVMLLLAQPLSNLLPAGTCPGRPSTGPSLPPPSHTRSPIGSPLGSLSQKGELRAYHVPCKYHTAWVRFRLSAGGTPSAIGELGAPIPDPLPFGPSLVSPCGASQHLWLVLSDDVYQRFTYVNHTTLSEPPTASVLAVATSSHDSVANPGVQPAYTELSGEGYTCPQSFTPHRYQ